jgi:hypothetical protein
MRFRIWIQTIFIGIFLFSFPAVKDAAASHSVVHREIVKYGPFTLPSSMDSSMGMMTVLERMTPPCEGEYFTKIKADLIYADGSKANYDTNVMLHHVVIYNQNKDNLTCPGVGISEQVFGSGNERIRLELPPGYGYQIEKNPNWAFMAEVMNLSKDQQNVYVSLDVMCVDRPLKAVRSLWLDINNCGDSQFTAPAGFSETTADWKSSLSGTIVGIGGHVHDYGIGVSAEDLTRQDIIATSVAGYPVGSAFAPIPVTSGGMGHPGRARTLRWYTNPSADASYQGNIQNMQVKSPFFHVAEGDTIRLYARYNVPASLYPEGIDTVMGIMLAYIYPD